MINTVKSGRLLLQKIKNVNRIEHCEKEIRVSRKKNHKDATTLSNSLMGDFTLLCGCGSFFSWNL